MRARNRPHEAKSRPFGGLRRPWGHVSRHCIYCGGVGPRVIVFGGYAHRRCVPKEMKRSPQNSTQPRKARAVKLSYAMRQDLKNLAQPDHHIHSRSITNPTLKALRKRGLASVTYDRRTGEHWELTDAGRAAIQPRTE